MLQNPCPKEQAPCDAKLSHLQRIVLLLSIMTHPPFRPSLLLCLGCTLLSSAVWAGRPLSVDDADVNDVDHGHVETWFERTTGPTRSLIVAPAYAPVEGLEIAGAFTRDTSAPASSMMIQAKWRITPVQEAGCNVGASASISKTQGESGNTPAVNGLLTCHLPMGAVHVNLGATRVPGESSVMTWGLALEHKFGSVTGHIETFGQQHAKSTLQAGSRYEIAKDIQVDGTVGRSDGQNLFSLGVKFQF